MPRMAGRHAGYVRFGLFALVLAIGFWYAQQHGLISSSSPCGRHLKISSSSTITRQIRLTGMRRRDGYIVAVQGKDTKTGEQRAINTIQHNHPDEPTIPEVRTLQVGHTYTMKIYVFTEADTHKGCGEPKVYDYLIGIDTAQSPQRTTAI